MHHSRTPVAPKLLLAVFLIPILVLFTSCDTLSSSTPTPKSATDEPGDLTVAVTTGGEDTDTTGYTLQAGSYERKVAVDDTITFESIPTASYNVSINGIAANCGAKEADSRPAVGVESNENTRISFSINCRIAHGILLERGSVNEGESVRLFLPEEDEERTLLRENNISHPVWLPDGSGFLLNVGGTIHRYTTDGTQLGALTQGISYVSSRYAVSPNGELIAATVRAEDEDMSELRTINIQTGEVNTLTNEDIQSGRVPSEPAFSPDGETLVFASHRDGNWEIYSVPTDGSAEPTNLTESPETDGAPSFGPRGEWVTFTREKTVWKMRSDGSEQTQVEPRRSDEVYLDPTFRDNGNQIAFVSNRDGKWLDLYITTSDGAPITQHSSGDHLRFPDSRQWR